MLLGTTRGKSKDTFFCCLGDLTLLDNTGMQIPVI